MTQTARSMLQVTAFGSIQLSVAGQAVRLRQDQAFVVAVLVAAGPDGLSRSELYRQLYGESRQKSGEQAAVMRVRRLRDRLEREQNAAASIQVVDRFGLDVDQCEVDVWQFQQRRASDDPDVLLELARRWGEPYAGLVDEADLLVTSRNELLTSYTQMMTRLGWMIEPGFGQEAAHWLENLIDQDPFNEHLVASTAGALYRLGRQTAASRLISDCRAQLRDEFGLSPGPHLDEVELALLNQDNERLASRRPSVGHGPPVGHSPPDLLVEPQRFVGRTDVLSSLSDAIERLRQPSGSPGHIHLVVGPAGMGKTTLLRKLLSSLDPTAFSIRLGRVRSVRSLGRDGVSVDPPETYGLIVDALPELRSAVADLNRSIDDESGRIRFWQTAHAYLQELAALKPTVVVFEDIHDADSQSLALLRYLVAAARPSSLMIIMSARSHVLDSKDQANELIAVVESENGSDRGVGIDFAAGHPRACCARPPRRGDRGPRTVRSTALGSVAGTSDGGVHSQSRCSTRPGSAAPTRLDGVGRGAGVTVAREVQGSRPEAAAVGGGTVGGDRSRVSST